MGLAVGDVIALTYKSTYQSQQIRYVLHWRVTVPGTSTTPEADLDAMAANFINAGVNTLLDSLLNVHVAGFVFNSAEAQRVSPTRTISMESATDSPGTVVGTESPANTAVVITKRTLTAGRRGIGSLHLSGFDSTSQTNGILVAPLLALYQTVSTEVLNARTVTAVGMSIEPGLFNPGMGPSFFSRLFDTNVQDTIRVMRRRTVRVGI